MKWDVEILESNTCSVLSSLKMKTNLIFKSFLRFILFSTSLTLRLSLLYAHTHTHTHTHVRAHTHAHTYTAIHYFSTKAFLPLQHSSKPFRRTGLITTLSILFCPNSYSFWGWFSKTTSLWSMLISPVKTDCTFFCALSAFYILPCSIYFIT